METMIRAGRSAHAAVACCRVEAGAHASAHERATHEQIARRLAALLGLAFCGEAAARERPAGSVYWVPNDTLVGADAARALGVAGPGDLFGGVVPRAFVATKAISHGLVAPGAAAPEGWCADFARRVRPVTLEGFTAFTRDDARAAGRRLLARGPVRIKPVAATGGHGQAVADGVDALDASIDAVAPSALDGPGASGVTLEQDLVEVVTFSVGLVEVGGIVAAYRGTQRTTPDNRGGAAYGGSTLDVVRGGFDAVLDCAMSADERLAVEQARVYDAAALECFGGLSASRRNYDVALGRDARGQRRCGVLEQSWRVGGASPAEIVALEALRADPGLRRVRACCVETYGAGHRPPPGAAVFFEGLDAQAGALLKYAWAEPLDREPAPTRARH